MKAAHTLDWSIVAAAALLPVVIMATLLVVAPGYLQSMAEGSAGKWTLACFLFAQIAVNFSIKKIVDFSIKKIVDLKV